VQSNLVLGYLKFPLFCSTALLERRKGKNEKKDYEKKREKRGKLEEKKKTKEKRGYRGFSYQQMCGAR